MKDESALFFEISEGRWPYENPTTLARDRDRIQRLIKVLKHTLSIPLLLSARATVTEHDFAELIDLLERFVFRYITMSSAHAGALANTYYKYAKLLRTNPQNYSLSALQNDLKNLQSSNATDQIFEASLRDKLNYRQQSSRITIRHFLSTIEDYLQWYNGGANGRPVPNTSRMLDINGINIEHIYPRNPIQGQEDPALEPIKDDIGNLTFWAPGDNSAAGNTPFSKKKALYEKSMVLMNHELAVLPAWDKQALDNRRNRLIKIAMKVFTA
jgi:hypothetical protein